jgi:hypothetical protein
MGIKGEKREDAMEHHQNHAPAERREKKAAEALMGRESTAARMTSRTESNGISARVSVCVQRALWPGSQEKQ